jgi:hypothetical protein
MSETRHYGPGSDEGGENWANLASLIETCKFNDINPQAYFTNLLTHFVNGWPQARIDELIPTAADWDSPPWDSQPLEIQIRFSCVAIRRSGGWHGRSGYHHPNRPHPDRASCSGSADR